MHRRPRWGVLGWLEILHHRCGQLRSGHLLCKYASPFFAHSFLDAHFFGMRFPVGSIGIFVAEAVVAPAQLRTNPAASGSPEKSGHGDFRGWPFNAIEG